MGRKPFSIAEKEKTVEERMQKYVCGVCGYVYDPEKGDPEGSIPAGTPFEKLPDDWTCPVCGAEKSEFSPE
ncbi:MAG TPA: rubredoxin [Deltaproteobacteria bacterium]|nr:rubredoxin [Deltaproteobacteria bacterium]HPR53865.1 rubredoxin [Deltaproteobacteria bacterium]HXK45935.1 rubredoxin [Deltaproteobacteria bacterium]